MSLLTHDEIQQQLAHLHQWTHSGDALEKTIVFADFSAALGMMMRIGIEAEKMNHHPEWSNVYNRLHIRLSTHDAGGITSKDVALATAIDQLVG